jgi:hypothetical protein
MGVGEFSKPKPGPQTGGAVKVGETVNYKDLPPERKAELGDLESLKTPETPEPEMAPDVAARAAEGAAQLEALHQALAKEEAEVVDVAEQRLAEMAEPTDEDKRSFLRSVLGGHMYSKRYEMFGGLFVMTLHDVAPAFEDTLFSSMAQELDAGRIKTDADWELLLDKMRLVVNVESFRFGKNEAVKCSMNDGALADQAVERQNMFPSSTVYRAALQTVRVFVRHMELMLDRALDSDFWVDGGLDSPSELMSEAPSDTESVPA